MLEFSVQHRLAVYTQPLIQQGRVELAEVSVILQISIDQIGQAGVLAARTGFHSRTQHE